MKSWASTRISQPLLQRRKLAQVRHYQQKHPNVAPPIESVRDQRDRDRVDAARVAAARGQGAVLTSVGGVGGGIHIRRTGNAPPAAAAAGGPARRSKATPVPKAKGSSSKNPKSKDDKEGTEEKDGKGKRHGRK